MHIVKGFKLGADQQSAADLGIGHVLANFRQMGLQFREIQMAVRVGVHGFKVGF
jgi:hypothetical protein